MLRGEFEKGAAGVPADEGQGWGGPSAGLLQRQVQAGHPGGSRRKQVSEWGKKLAKEVHEKPLVTSLNMA